MLDSSTRLYRLEGGSVFDDLHVEAYVLEEALSQPWRLEIIALRGSGRADTEAMLEQPVTLVTVLADGSEHRRTGSVMGVDREDSHGKGTRYRLYVQPWLGFLLETRHSWVWVDKSIHPGLRQRARPVHRSRLGGQLRLAVWPSNSARTSTKTKHCTRPCSE